METPVKTFFSGQADVTVVESELIEVYQKILWSSQCSITTKEYALTSLMKLSARLNHEVGWAYQISLKFKGSNEWE